MSFAPRPAPGEDAEVPMLPLNPVMTARSGTNDGNHGIHQCVTMRTWSSLFNECPVYRKVCVLHGLINMGRGVNSGTGGLGSRVIRYSWLDLHVCLS